jgi:AraC-like DNA-binding protein
MANGTLDRLLVTLDVAVNAFAICEVRRGLRLVAKPDEAIVVHYVLQGTMYLMVPGKQPIVCGPGTVVIIPPATPQNITADDQPAEDVITSENCSMMRDGLLVYDAAQGAAPDLRFACGLIMASFSGSFGLLDQIEEPIAEDLMDVEIVRHAFAIMLDEVSQPRMGTRALTSALMKICLMMFLRRHFEDMAPHSVLLAGLRHPRLGKAVAAVLDKPATPHTVASLATEAGMSRSAFAREFRESFTMSPMAFVAKTRLHHAAELLKSSTASIKVIAASIGFASRSHFSRAFRDAYGTDPSNFRKTVSTTEIDAPRSLRSSRERFGLAEEPG